MIKQTGLVKRIAELLREAWRYDMTGAVPNMGDGIREWVAKYIAERLQVSGQRQLEAEQHWREEVAQFLDKEVRRGHYYCEDNWFSCPKAEDGCSDETKGDECRCGADIYNAKIDQLLANQPKPFIQNEEADQQDD